MGTDIPKGHSITFTEDTVVGNGWFADLRDQLGRVIESGGGHTQDAARAHLLERVQRTSVSTPVSEEVLRGALELTRAALAIPYPATVGDAEVHSKILDARVTHALLMIGSVLDNRDPRWAMEYCRERLAENPAEGYRSSGMHVLR